MHGPINVKFGFLTFGQSCFVRSIADLNRKISCEIEENCCRILQHVTPILWNVKYSYRMTSGNASRAGILQHVTPVLWNVKYSYRMTSGNASRAGRLASSGM